ncbi:hypothetical protein ACFWBN_01630 [Streptomyces sp. NPDC059989]|uniref:hypothetical protein n=1 Tax=Streptomyces sp. NPDC059989 TaxID=3347026 RepID=UPI0036863CB8
MTRPWEEFIANGPALAPHYDEVPELTGVRLRSVHLDGWGSAVTLRLDLPGFPDRWEGGPGDTMQCQVAFSHVADFVMEGWRPPVTADVVLTELPAHRLAVRVEAPGTGVSFTANASVLVGKFSVFTRDPDGGDGGPHHFAGRLDGRLYPTVPPTYANPFYERL